MGTKKIVTIKNQKGIYFVNFCGECPYLKWTDLKTYPKKSYKCSKLGRKTDPLVMNDKCPFKED